MPLEKTWDPFEILIKDYYQSIYAMAISQTGNVEDARDITQDVFARAYAGLGSLKDPFKAGEWLKGIARHVCVDWLRKKKLKDKFLDSKRHSNDLVVKPADDNPPDKTETHEKILAAINKLPEDYRQVLILRYMENLSYEEIAETAGFSRDAVRGILYRGTKILREKLKDLTDSL